MRIEDFLSASGRGGQAYSLILFCAALICSANLAFAHAFWLVPVEGQVQPDERVVFDLRIGPNWPGEPVMRDTKALISQFALDDGTRKLPINGREGARPVGHYEAEIPGANYAVMTTYPHISALSGGEFEAYLEEEGLENAQEIRRKYGIQSAPARERFRRNVKALILVGGDSRGFDRDLGLALELIPITDPLKYSVGRPFTIRLLRDGKPLANKRITASLRDSESVLKLQTDRDGRAQFKLPAAGMWMFYAVDISQATELGLDWESIWTSLTLKVEE